jgi:lipoate-protein ligase A
MNMAIDEAIFMARIEDQIPNTLRFYTWNPSAVSIGKFQSVEKEVNLENCKKHGVDVVRRITGGGAVYHDKHGEITYSVVANKKDFGNENIIVIYKKIYSGLANTLKKLGIDADFDEGNTKKCPNLTVKGKKISGSAQAHRKIGFLQHGTVLINVDLQKMFTFLRVPWGKTRLEIVNVAKNKISAINRELEKKISKKILESSLIEGFRKSFKLPLAEGKLTVYEQILANKLYYEKYCANRWNLYGESS